MERRTVSELKEHFQCILRNAEKDPKLVITEVEETEGSKIGDNYMSVVLRTNVSGRRGNGEHFSDTFMTKYYPRHRKVVAIVRNAELFQNEAYVYNRLLPLFGNIAPRCIFANQDEIVMKDLKSIGYVIQPKRDFLDTEHSTAVVETLAKLHAQSLALKLRDPEGFRELVVPLKEVVFPWDDRPCIGLSVEPSISLAVEHLESLQDRSEDVQSAIEFCKDLEGKVFETIRKLVTPDQAKYNVLTHGDPWSSNFLFKHDANGRVVDVKLIDFQVVRHVSSAIDFNYFVYTSAKANVIEQSHQELVKCYHSALIKNLQDLRAPEECTKEMSLAWWDAEVKKYELYGLLCSFWLINAMLAEDSDAINMDDLTPEFLTDSKLVAPPITPVKAERIKCVVLHYFRRTDAKCKQKKRL